MDYRRFLTKVETRDLVWFGGLSVEVGGRRVRLDPAAPRPAQAGWVRFEVGRFARALGPAEPDEAALEAAPAVRGHVLGERLVSAGAKAEPMFGLPSDELPRFSPALARRWPSGALVFHRAELEGGVEDEVRRAFEDGRGLDGVAGVPATLRAAFGFTRGLEVGRRRQIPVSPGELVGVVRALSEAEGVEVAEQHLRAIAAERAARPRGASAEAPGGLVAEGDERIFRALERIGGELLDLRRTGEELLEVTWRFLGERFLTVVDRVSLRVVDAGICLDGHDDRLTLESLPGVIRAGHESGELVITRWANEADR